ncbi:MAG: diguanylate cyclase [Burkholderiales bacterium]|nr:diguanylate cyclase [Burkholderiales bacterium]
MNTVLDLAPLPPLAGAELQRLLATLLPDLLDRAGQLLAVKSLASGRYVHVNPALAAWLGRPVAEVLGCTDAELFEPGVALLLRAADQTAHAQAKPLVSEHRLERAGVRHEFSVLRLAVAADAGGPGWLCSVWTPLGAERQREATLQAALAQIEQQQQALEMLRRELADQALRDPASGLYRRANFEDQWRREADLSLREHREFAIVFIELDPLPPKVLAFGDAGRQRVLEALGRLQRGGTRAMDASCRYDEQRFAVLLSGVGLATAHARMESLRRKCATEIVVHEGQDLGFSVAMGVASFPHTAHTHEDLVAACDAALAEARRRGGNLVTLAAIRFETAG